ncbi:MAG: hypothetical protein GYB50_24345 [Rhodobacteraceae bacterium]|uniref:hypothetical protein n=1 Tax=Salipiger thiooxidans TaxID=282683 RepID=UPI001A8C8A98|nr:hypothetical protein [Salipiger thiooxidans]MBN8190086.1 hypothetical protein [Salipiger thiooxidans]MBR9840988.1 hypothetical protein [Paracoccaceae bacterium]
MICSACLGRIGPTPRGCYSCLFASSSCGEHAPPLPRPASPVLAWSTERGAGQEAADLELVTGFHEGVFLDHEMEESASVVADDDIQPVPKTAANEHGMF